MKSIADCPECGGGCELECDSCGSIIECETCHGTGWDDEQIDTEAWVKADQEFTSDNGGCSWDWYWDGECIGREARNGEHLSVADFVRKR